MSSIKRAPLWTTPQPQSYFNRVYLQNRPGGKRFKVFENALQSVDGKNLKGFGVDLDGDGRFSKRNDGFLSLDFDGDGVYSADEIAGTNQLLKAFGGNEISESDFFTPNTGPVNPNVSSRLKSIGQDIDLNKDGVLATWELRKAGAKVMRVSAPADGVRTEEVYFPGLDEQRPPHQPPAQQNFFHPFGRQTAFFQGFMYNMLQQFTAMLNPSAFGATFRSF